MGRLMSIELLLYHRPCRPRGGYGVCVAMHDLPGAVFGTEGHRNSQIAGGDILSSANLCIGALYPQDAGKLRSHVLRYGLEVVDLAISEIRMPHAPGPQRPHPIRAREGRRGWRGLRRL